MSGSGSAINWVCYGYYVSLCANESNKGRFNGYIWIFIQTAFLAASLIGGSVIGKYGYLSFYTAVPIMTSCATLLSCGLPTPGPSSDTEKDKEVEMS